jgi:VCBS repeat-containing protein
VVEDGSEDVFGVDLTTVEGQLYSTDIDNNSSVDSWDISGDSQGTYGSLSVDPNTGKWTYTLDNTLTATQDLDAGQTGTETFYVTMTDNDGAVSGTHQITVNVIGQDETVPGLAVDHQGSGGAYGHDHPHILDSETIELQEDATLASNSFALPAGYLNIVSESGGIYGQLIEDPNNPGQWIYELDNDSPLVQSLDEGQVVTETWRIEVPRQNPGNGQGNGLPQGVYDYYEVKVNITGKADKPEITYETDTNSPQNDTILLGEALEDVSSTITGYLGVEDIDMGEVFEWSVDNSTGSYGTLTVDPDTGEWTYVLDPGVQLPAESEVFDTFNVTVTDTDPAEGLATKSDTREVKVKIIGTAENIDNPNPGDQQIVVETIGTAEDNNTPNTKPESIVISSTQPLTLDSSLSLGDQISWTLVDGAGTYGSIVVSQDGSWTFTLDNDSQAVQSLQTGETREDVFDVFAVDQYGKTIVDDQGLPQTLQIVVNVDGLNDKPELSANVVQTIEADDSDEMISGTLLVQDADSNDSHTWQAQATDVNPDYGTLSLDEATGAWSYQANTDQNDIVALNPGQSITQTWKVTVTDERGLSAEQTLAIVINGVNEPLSVQTDDGSVTEGLTGTELISVTKAITLADDDAGDELNVKAVELNGTYGRFIVDPVTQTWTYELANDKPHVQALGQGVSVTEQFVIQGYDKYGAEVFETVEVTVFGSNDSPTVSGDIVGSVSDVIGDSVAGQLAVSDVDIGDNVSFVVTKDSDLGTFNIDSNGNWTFDIDPDNATVNALAKGQTMTTTIGVVARDDSGVIATQDSDETTITITIIGSNDAPAIADVVTQQLTENTLTQLAGTFDSGDVDVLNVADSHQWQLVSGDDRGQLVVDADTGEWTFELTGDFEYLQAGENLAAPLLYEIRVMDEHGASDTQIIEFQVTGTNDAPMVVVGESTLLSTVYEDQIGGSDSTMGIVKIIDVDTNDTQSYSLASDSILTELAGDYGTLKLLAGDSTDTIKWEYVLDQSKADSLGEEIVQEQFDLFIESLVSGSPQGDAITQTITINIDGNNDVPEITGSFSGDVKEGARDSVAGVLNTSDVDGPSTVTRVLQGGTLVSGSQYRVMGNYGQLTFDTNTGVWAYVILAGSTNALASGEQQPDTFYIDVSDGDVTIAQPITVTVTGNDSVKGESLQADILSATVDDEWLFGNDVPLDGGVSSDKTEQDVFQWDNANLAGQDVIKDFDVKDFANSNDPAVMHDVVDLQNVVFQSNVLLSDQLTIKEQNGDTVIQILESGSSVQAIVIEGVTLNQLLNATESDISGMSNAELIVALYQTGQLALPDQIRVGSAADEALTGTASSDIIAGGGGQDILTGGEGADLFLFTEASAGSLVSPSVQTVTDFSIGEDLLDISDLLPEHDALNDLLSNITVVVNDDASNPNDVVSTVISIQNGDERTDITLDGVGWDALNISDSNVINDPGAHQLDLISALDSLHIIKTEM